MRSNPQNITQTRTTGLWVAAVLVALVFFSAGIPKIFLYRDWVLRFALWDYPQWLVVVVGIIETAGAVAVLIRRVAFAGAATLCVVMIAALITHFVHREGKGMLGPIVIFALLYPILNKERPRGLIEKLRGLILKKPEDSKDE